MGAFAKNLLAGAVGVLTLLFLLEFVVFRLFFVASDLPHLEEQDRASVLKFAPHQQGFYRIKNEIKSEFHINADGWNSGVDDYLSRAERSQDLVMVVGDSYVEALQVNHRKSFAEKLEESLSDGETVYRFGISGAPLSHYLYMLRELLPKYRPSLVVVLMVHNDFHESLKVGSGTYGASLARVIFDSSDRPYLSTPQLYRKSPTSWIKKSAIFGYVWVRQQVRPYKIKQFWNSVMRRQDSQLEYAANINLSNLDNMQAIETVVDFVFLGLRELGDLYQTKFLLVLDGDRGAITDAVDTGGEFSSKMTPIHDLIRVKSLKSGLDLLDLTGAFMQDYKKNGVAFSFLNDGHWNSYTHRLAGRTIAAKIVDMRKE